MFNYNPDANVNDGSCYPFIFGCLDENACNYIPPTGINTVDVNSDDDSCTFVDGVCETCVEGEIIDNDIDNDGICDADEIGGCQDETACNYDSLATDDDGSCEYAQLYYDCDGVCLNDADGDGVCDELEIFGCTDSTAFNYDLESTEDDGSCIPVVLGCTLSSAFNYDESANVNDGSCCFISGCTNPDALNYNQYACFNDGSCVPFIYGCTD